VRTFSCKFFWYLGKSNFSWTTCGIGYFPAELFYIYVLVYTVHYQLKNLYFLEDIIKVGIIPKQHLQKNFRAVIITIFIGGQLHGVCRSFDFLQPLIRFILPFSIYMDGFILFFPFNLST
jgi:hypothetical protein